ncbi:pentatricopeptide repeat-containing protein At4g38150 isoform X1 [Arachis stenosperma]|uniref:pentatricopeptide repeat-containing protein At4g38150 isoform X1 n=2 Tax=Arachis stenosperma TaxID=217475 RepID=UPI0025AC12E2|nr:pentatricopeptide repeat-containing protein At4g38150 isoform X1 [Arachis stenosperma]
MYLPFFLVHMPTMLGRLHKLVPPASSKQYLAPCFKTLRHYSFVDDGGGRSKQHVQESHDEDFSLKQSDFNGSGINGSQEGYGNQQFPPEPIPDRPLRGGRPTNQPPRPRVRERSGDSHSFPPKFEDDHGRPDLAFHGRNMAETGWAAGQSGESFLDKFKLGFDNKTANTSESASGNQSEEAKRSNPNQPASESMPQDANEIFKKMKETGLIPNAVAMLDGLCKDGFVQEALKLFGLMREKGTIPEIVIYTAVVEGFTKAHKADDAIRIFRKMQSNGISPNVFSYTVLVQGLSKCGRLQDAFEFCVEMLEAGHYPNTTTFVGLVDSFCKEKGVEEAKDAIKTLTDKGFNLDKKAVREFLDKKAPFSPSVWEAILGKTIPQRPF